MLNIYLKINRNSVNISRFQGFQDFKIKDFNIFKIQDFKISTLKSPNLFHRPRDRSRGKKMAGGFTGVDPQDLATTLDPFRPILVDLGPDGHSET